MQYQKVLYGEVKFDDALSCLDALNANVNSADAVISNFVDKFCSGEKSTVSVDCMNGLLYTLMLNVSFISAAGQQLYDHVQLLERDLKRIKDISQNVSAIQGEEP